MTYDMSYSGPEVVLPIGKLGTVRVCFTDGGHAHVSSNSNSRYDGDVVTSNGEHWYLSMHVYAKLDWSEDMAYTAYRHKGSSLAAYGRDMPSSWRAKVSAAVTEAVKAFVSDHPDVLTVAARNKLTHDLDHQDKEIAEAQETLDQLKIGRANIMNELLELPELA